MSERSYPDNSEAKLPAESVTDGLPTTRGPMVQSGGSQPLPSKLDDSLERQATLSDRIVQQLRADAIHSEIRTGNPKETRLSWVAADEIERLRSLAQDGQEIDAWMRADGSAATVNPMTAGMWKAQGHIIEPLYLHPARRDAQSASVRVAAERVCQFDWSDNDMDAVAAIEALRRAITIAPAQTATSPSVSIPVDFIRNCGCPGASVTMTVGDCADQGNCGCAVNLLARMAAHGLTVSSTMCTCGGDPGQPQDHHDISCPMAVSSPHSQCEGK